MPRSGNWLGLSLYTDEMAPSPQKASRSIASSDSHEFIIYMHGTISNFNQDLLQAILFI